LLPQNYSAQKGEPASNKKEGEGRKIRRVEGDSSTPNPLRFNRKEIWKGRGGLWLTVIDMVCRMAERRLVGTERGGPNQFSGFQEAKRGPGIAADAQPVELGMPAPIEVTFLHFAREHLSLNTE